jgi:hypothetical protein
MMLEGSGKVSRPANSALSYVSRMRAAGFENITKVYFRWP